MITHNRFFRSFLAIVLISMFSISAEAKTLNIALVFDGPDIAGQSLVSDINEELENLVGDFDKIEFTPELQFVGNWKKNQIDEYITQALKNPQADALLCVGPVASHLLCQRKSLPKPSFASQIFNARAQKVAVTAEDKGRRNLNYIDLALNFSGHLEKFQQIRRFDRLGLVVSSYLAESIPEIQVFLKRWAEENQVEFRLLTADRLLQQHERALHEVDAVYVAPMPDLDETQFKRIINIINAAKTPSMNMVGKKPVEKGLMSSLALDVDNKKLARRIALNLQRLTFLDEDPISFSNAFSAGERLHINMKTAKQIEVYPTWSQMTDAVLISAEPENLERELNLTQVIETAVVRNLQLAAKYQEIEASGHGVDRARSSLRPKLSLFGRETVIDSDRAESIMSPSRFTTQIGVDLIQVLYSEQARANIDIQKLMLAAKKEEERALILDIMRDAALAYLNVLKTKTLQAIQRDNLEVTRANLDIARFREQVGTSGPAEVYRWEIQMASARQAIIDASVMRKKAELALNQLLNAGQEEEFTTADCDIFARVFLIDQNLVAPYIDNMFGFKVFRDFLVNDTLALSPEIQQVENSLKAQKRANRSARRRFSQPTVALQGNFSRTLKEDGTGNPKPALPAPFGSVLKYPDKNDWFVGLNISIPLHEGGDRRAAVKQTDSTIKQLENNLEFLMQRLELNTRISLEDARSSFSSIGLSNTRAEYAAKTLDLVQSAYQRGAVNILDLIDAQNASLVAKEASANAMFNFFSDFVKVCRAVGSFEFILDRKSHDEWHSRLQNYYRENAVNALIDRKPAADKPEIGGLSSSEVLYNEDGAMK
ncbi:MAG: outer membrane protein [Clostridiales bacterium]|jgi:outer membrane protein TolC|nr:outer membrane protein [Clostridiales bacterium]MDN5281744.1 outer membrane protein [Candidatus Ozemobacter sp.]